MTEVINGPPTQTPETKPFPNPRDSLEDSLETIKIPSQLDGALSLIVDAMTRDLDDDQKQELLKELNKIDPKSNGEDALLTMLLFIAQNSEQANGNDTQAIQSFIRIKHSIFDEEYQRPDGRLKQTDIIDEVMDPFETEYPNSGLYKATLDYLKAHKEDNPALRAAIRLGAYIVIRAKDDK